MSRSRQASVVDVVSSSRQANAVDLVHRASNRTTDGVVNIVSRSRNNLDVLDRPIEVVIWSPEYAIRIFRNKNIGKKNSR